MSCSLIFSRALRLLRAAAALAVAAAPFVCAPTATAQSAFDTGPARRLSNREVGVILNKVRGTQIGEVCLRFVIQHVPRKSDETVTYEGTLWTGRRNNINVFRLELSPPAGDKSGKRPLRLFLKSGEDAELWTNGGPGGAPARADATSNKPFFEGLIFTPLELQTPFLHWGDVSYERTARFRGRPTHFFRAVPPAAFKRANPNINAVRFGTDKGFGDFVILQAIVLGDGDKELRKYEAETFTNVRGVYLPEEMRALDIASRDKDIFRVTAAAVNVNHPPGIFDPSTLNESAPQPSEARFEKLQK
ncbi:MAG: hypothetical protein LBT53_05905 [Puniceicoccales bacterium]|jgi:hypothetical protein|nr:hypothetical protein [Puniceicoccales bacterium]